MDTKNLETKVDVLNESIKLMTLIELVKLGVTREEAREVLGSVNNTIFSKVNSALMSKKTKENGKKEGTK